MWFVDYLQHSNYITQSDVEFARNHIKTNTFNLLKEQMRNGPIEQSINKKVPAKELGLPVWFEK